MSDAAAPTPTICWLAPAQADLCRAVAASARLHITAVGSPDPSDAPALARAFDAEPLTDLRSALATAAGGLALIAAPGQFGGGGSRREPARVDADELDNARARGVKVASLEPLPGSLAQLVAVGHPAGSGREGLPGEWALIAPLSRFARPVVEAVEALEAFGPIRTAALTCLGTPAEGSLGARLFDAMDLLNLFLGEPEFIHAAYSSPLATRGIHPVASETLDGLTGDLSISARMTDGRAATVLASDAAAAYGLTVELIGPGGRMNVTLDRCTWLGPDRVPPEGLVWRRREPAAELIAAQLRRYLDTGVDLAGQVDFARALAMAQCALLSTRTGDVESPATMLKMAGV